ncbi:hypothetical protein EZV62_003731 [Acer yangbiense]|uniref:Phosphofructokinase domain-containing protein n=1 Tax=Acer yangbiense TaxID=1000413 RepID=A0A5C7IK25_9ROSI|nr:hypothetical protein EZV62_003731 [Acer yangbiense]
MDSTISSSASLSIPKFRCFDPTYAYSPTAANHRRSFSNFSPTFKSSSRVNMVDIENYERKIVTGDAGYVLEDVPHLSDYIPDLPTYPNPLQDNPSYSVVKQYFVNADDTIVVHKDSPRGTHFRRAGPRQRVYFESNEVYACIVTCGGLCPGLNTVIREIVCGLHYMYGVNNVLGIEGGYRGFYARNTIPLTPKVVNDIHKRGGTILGTSRGGHDTSKIVDSIQDRGINQETTRRGLKVAVAGIPKTIDNDIPAQRAINAEHVVAESIVNGIGVVKLMGLYSGQDLLNECMRTMDQQDASGNKLLQDVGLWISQKIKEHFAKRPKMPINLKYIDPTYMIRAIPSNASDNVYCTLLAHSAIHGAMAGYTGFTVGPVNGRHAYIPFHRVTERQNKVVITDRMWARLLSSTNQPSFLDQKDISRSKTEEVSETPLLSAENHAQEIATK